MEVEPVTFIPDISDALTIQQVQEKFDVIVDHWLIYTTICNFIKRINESLTKSSTYSTIFCLTLYLLSWSYIAFLTF